MSEEIVSCPQSQCCYNGICVGTEKVGCQNCEECGCEPNMIDTNCDRCLSCSRESGELRWGNGNEELEEEVEVELEPIINLEENNGNK